MKVTFLVMLLFSVSLVANAASYHYDPSHYGELDLEDEFDDTYYEESSTGDDSDGTEASESTPDNDELNDLELYYYYYYGDDTAYEGEDDDETSPTNYGDEEPYYYYEDKGDEEDTSKTVNEDFVFDNEIYWKDYLDGGLFLEEGDFDDEVEIIEDEEEDDDSEEHSSEQREEEEEEEEEGTEDGNGNEGHRYKRSPGWIWKYRGHTNDKSVSKEHSITNRFGNNKGAVRSHFGGKNRAPSRGKFGLNLLNKLLDFDKDNDDTRRNNKGQNKGDDSESSDDDDERRGRQKGKIKGRAGSRGSDGRSSKGSDGRDGSNSIGSRGGGHGKGVVLAHVYGTPTHYYVRPPQVKPGVPCPGRKGDDGERGNHERDNDNDDDSFKGPHRNRPLSHGRYPPVNYYGNYRNQYGGHGSKHGHHGTYYG